MTFDHSHLYGSAGASPAELKRIAYRKKNPDPDDKIDWGSWGTNEGYEDVDL